MSESDLPGVFEGLERSVLLRPRGAALRQVGGGEVWSHRELRDNLGRCGSFLRGRLAPGDCVMVQEGNTARYVAWVLGALRSGMRALPVHPLLTEHEVRALARAVGARVIVGESLYDGLERVDLESFRDREVGGGGEEGGSLLMQTSGSTGVPRIARRSMGSLDADGQGLAGRLGLCGEDVVLAATPLSHSYGVDVLMAGVSAGACVDVCRVFEPALVEEHLEREGVTVFPAVPVMLGALGRGERRQMPSLRVVLSAGGVLGAEAGAGIERRWGVRPGQLYGSTELGTVVMGLSEDADFDPSSVGKALPGVSILIGGNGGIGGRIGGEEGEVRVRAASMLSEYVGAELMLEDGHLATGDLGRVDSRGRLYLSGRLSHLIDVGGMKVNPVEVESVMAQHPGVGACVACGVAMSESVTRVRLVYVPREGAPTDGELRRFARARLAAYKVPRVFEARASLPMTPTGKILRHMIDT